MRKRGLFRMVSLFLLSLFLMAGCGGGGGGGGTPPTYQVPQQIRNAMVQQFTEWGIPQEDAEILCSQLIANTIDVRIDGNIETNWIATIVEFYAPNYLEIPPYDLKFVGGALSPTNFPEDPRATIFFGEGAIGLNPTAGDPPNWQPQEAILALDDDTQNNTEGYAVYAENILQYQWYQYYWSWIGQGNLGVEQNETYKDLFKNQGTRNLQLIWQSQCQSNIQWKIYHSTVNISLDFIGDTFTTTNLSKHFKAPLGAPDGYHQLPAIFVYRGSC